MQNCVIKIHGFFIIKKGEIVRKRFGSTIMSLSFDDNKEYVWVNNFCYSNVYCIFKINKQVLLLMNGVAKTLEEKMFRF